MKEHSSRDYVTRSLTESALQSRPATDADADWAGVTVDGQAHEEQARQTRRLFRPTTWFNSDTGKADKDSSWVAKSAPSADDRRRANAHVGEETNSRSNGWYILAVVMFAVGVVSMVGNIALVDQLKGGLFIDWTPSRMIVFVVTLFAVWGLTWFGLTYNYPHRRKGWSIVGSFLVTMGIALFIVSLLLFGLSMFGLMGE